MRSAAAAFILSPMPTPKQRRDEHRRRSARSAPRRRLIGALVGGPLGLLAPLAGVLAWAAVDGGWAEHGIEPEGGTGALVGGALMLAVGVGFPIGLLGAVLARRVRLSREATWGDGVTAFVGAFLAGALLAVPLGWMLMRG